MHTNDRQGSAVGSFTTNSVLVGYENAIRRPGVFLRGLRMDDLQKVQHQCFKNTFPQTLVNLFQDATRGSAPLCLQKIDYE